MDTSRKSNRKQLRYAAVITLILVCCWLVAACSSPTAALNNSPISADKPLADTSNPTKLASGWTWYQGESKESAFKLDAGALTITAGPKTEQWGTTNAAPYVTYDVEGDFDVQTKLDFDNGRVSYWAGIGVMSADDPTQWVRLAPRGQSALSLIRNGGQEITTTTEFPVTTVFLKLQRRGDVISAYYSKAGDTWQPISGKYESTLPKKVKMYLVALALNKSISARFSEVKIGSS